MKRDDFIDKLDYGVPPEETTRWNAEVLFIYNQEGAFPSDERKAYGVRYDNRTIPLISFDEATENCEVVNVVTSKLENRAQCLVMVGKYESYHVSKWMPLSSLPTFLPSRWIAGTIRSKCACS